MDNFWDDGSDKRQDVSDSEKEQTKTKPRKLTPVEEYGLKLQRSNPKPSGPTDLEKYLLELKRAAKNTAASNATVNNKGTTPKKDVTWWDLQKNENTAKNDPIQPDSNMSLTTEKMKNTVIDIETRNTSGTTPKDLSQLETPNNPNLFDAIRRRYAER